MSRSDDEVLGNGMTFKEARTHFDNLPDYKTKMAFLKEASPEGNKLPGDQIEQMAAFAEHAVNTALAELIEAAGLNRTEFVPVDVIQHMIGLPKTAVRMLWKVVNDTGIDIDFGDTPDDLSELEGMEGMI